MSCVAIFTLCLVVAASLMQLVHPILSGLLFRNSFSFDPSQPFPKGLYMAIVVMPGITPYLADLVITLRLLHFYPIATTSAKKLLAIFAIPVLLKVGRLVSLTLFWIEFRASLDRSPTPLDIHGTTYPAATTEYAAQAADTIYSAIFCLWALRRALRGPEAMPVVRAKSFQKRLERLWNVLVFSFVLPAASSLALLLVSQLHSDPNILGLMIALNAMVCCVNILLSSVAIAAQNARHASETETAILVEDRSTAGDGRNSSGDAGSAQIEVYGGGGSAFFKRFRRRTQNISPLVHKGYNAHGGLEDRKTSGGGSPRLLPYGSYDDLSLPRSAGRGASVGRRSEGRQGLGEHTYDLPLRDVKIGSEISANGWSTESEILNETLGAGQIRSASKAGTESFVGDERSADWIETIARPSEIHDAQHVVRNANHAGTRPATASSFGSSQISASWQTKDVP
ncbi:hypothetical protein IE81DRAFT_327614 [Ceraceosorus guamensis]|uniref:Uncharacterized protein n=1 Tax=Ceraceosorus guamensis TaxID=1522189 RepID=A0A316WEK5_9BASI|nr:hypothetical protein IE81DRAFT_327614 [Ceraceosorus guamensis]PWN46183.1 hypothetical protein IE81DRAFT_327614 [Ceraceosorus guamensis]